MHGTRGSTIDLWILFQNKDYHSGFCLSFRDTATLAFTEYAFLAKRELIAIRNSPLFCWKETKHTYLRTQPQTATKSPNAAFEQTSDHLTTSCPQKHNGCSEIKTTANTDTYLEISVSLISRQPNKEPYVQISVSMISRQPNKEPYVQISVSLISRQPNTEPYVQISVSLVSRQPNKEPYVQISVSLVSRQPNKEPYVQVSVSLI